MSDNTFWFSIWSIGLLSLFFTICYCTSNCNNGAIKMAENGYCQVYQPGYGSVWQKCVEDK